VGGRSGWQIGAALGLSKQTVWESRCRWIDALAEAHRRSDLQGLDPLAVEAARRLAGGVDDAGRGRGG
jgi:hypothetical protein